MVHAVVGTGRSPAGPAPGRGAAAPRFPRELMHAAATMYYLEDATQADIAARLGMSRPSVSRLLTEAREHGVVTIEVPPLPVEEDSELAERVRAALDLHAVHLSTSVPGQLVPAALSAVLSEALLEVGLEPGDALLVSSGRTVYTVAHEGLPQLPGVLVVPMIGGQEEPEPWYQTNEITRYVADRVGGVPQFLHAPAMPGEELSAGLATDPGVQRVHRLWSSARCAVMGVGAPPTTRASIPSFAPTHEPALQAAAGDVLSRFYDADGLEVPLPGFDRLVATPAEVLRAVPVSIAVAHGEEKVPGVVAGARGRWFNQLVTDPTTAELVLTATQQARQPPAPASSRVRRRLHR